MLDHLFDYYPWRDDRLLNTPIPHNKFQFLAQILLQLEAKDAIPGLIEYLDQSKKVVNSIVYFLIIWKTFLVLINPY